MTALEPVYTIVFVMTSNGNTSMNITSNQEWQRRGQVFLLGLLSAGITLDIFDLCGRAIFPTQLQHFACSALPIARIAQYLIPPQLTEFASGQCAEQALEPGTSIDFFLIKLTMVLLAIVYFWMSILFDYKAATAIQFKQIKASGGPFSYLKKAGSLIIGLWCLYAFIFIRFDEQPISYITNISGKITEDLSCVILFIAILITTSATGFPLLYTYCGANELRKIK